MDRLNLYTLTLLVVLSACNGPESSTPETANNEEAQIEILSSDSLLDLVQKQTFNYFWDFAEAESGMARERSQDLETFTSGGTGLGIASFPAAVNRGWITRDQAIERLQKLLTFLESASSYHGAFAHWYDKDGNTKNFSAKDNGGDIVETAFLIQGLLINRQYFSEDNEDEKNIRDRITALWENVEWDWYTQGKKSITWHWSADQGFVINQPIAGWNEALITYVLAAASPTHTIDKETYENGWARNGDMKNNNEYYGHILPLGEPMGGPLFLSQYSFIALDPRGLKDQYANYFDQNRAHSLINYEYCKENPKGFKGYSENCWGLTASDDINFYAAHSPTNDLGVITPSAALSAFPYTPVESKKALDYFYYQMHDKLWGKYGFYDAFSEQENWVADGYLAIDQGPIVAMIENYRSQLLWSLFMSDQEILNGLDKLGFTYK